MVDRVAVLTRMPADVAGLAASRPVLALVLDGLTSAEAVNHRTRARSLLTALGHGVSETFTAVVSGESFSALHPLMAASIDDAAAARLLSQSAGTSPLGTGLLQILLDQDFLGQ